MRFINFFFRRFLVKTDNIGTVSPHIRVLIGVAIRILHNSLYFIFRFQISDDTLSTKRILINHWITIDLFDPKSKTPNEKAEQTNKKKKQKQKAYCFATFVCMHGINIEYNIFSLFIKINSLRPFLWAFSFFYFCWFDVWVFCFYWHRSENPGFFSIITKVNIT